jgi:hypothetical protein
MPGNAITATSTKRIMSQGWESPHVVLDPLERWPVAEAFATFFQQPAHAGGIGQLQWEWQIPTFPRLQLRRATSDRAMGPLRSSRKSAMRSKPRDNQRCMSKKMPSAGPTAEGIRAGNPERRVRSFPCATLQAFGLILVTLRLILPTSRGSHGSRGVNCAVCNRAFGSGHAYRCACLAGIYPTLKPCIWLCSFPRGSAKSFG